jgi:biofilm PGA synthesis N-glycosyltransferase PgaC
MMLTVFIFCISMLVYVFLGYPFVIYCLSLFIRKKPAMSDLLPTVSLIISAYNEQNIIAEKLENSLSLDYPPDKLEIIVASESTDRTNQIVEQFAGRGVVLFAFDGRQGKTATLYRTVPRAKGEIIVFSDANAMYGSDALKMLVRNFGDPRIGCVSGRLQYFNADAGLTGRGEGLYWNYEMVIKKIESSIFSLLGANGSIFAVRKHLYSPIAYDRGDDFELPVRVALNGSGVILESEAVSHEKSCERPAEEFGRKVRIIAWNMKSCLLLLKECLLKRKALLFFQLMSHKLLRWLFPLFVLGLFFSNIFLEGAFFRTLLILQLLFYLSGLMVYVLEVAGVRTPRFFLVPYYFCLMCLSTIKGLCLLFLGQQKSVWKKVRLNG